MDRKLGLVLAGGGGKGAYHIGVWRAMREYGVDAIVGDVSGTSVGALNAVLFALGNYEEAAEIWRGLDYSTVLSVNKTKLIAKLLALGLFGVSNTIVNVLAFGGIFTRDGISQIMDKGVHWERLHSTERHIYAGVYNLSRRNMEYLEVSRQHMERAKKILLATSALPVVYPSEVIDGENYIDGGVADNIPLEPLYRNGCRDFLVVHLNSESLIGSRERYQDARIYEIVPTEEQGGITDGTLDFSKEGIERRMRQGYTDACRVLEPLYHIGILQKDIGNKLRKMAEDDASTRNELKSISQHRMNLMEERQKLKEELQRMMRNV